MKRLMPVVAFVLFLQPSWAPAHGGRTDSSGCHNDRKNGGYHCHGGGRSSGSSGSSRSRESDPAKPTRFEVVAVPRARIFVGGQDLGVSPTRAMVATARDVTVEVRHPVLGTTTQTFKLTEGVTNTLQFVW